jgi:hypothetical protein
VAVAVATPSAATAVGLFTSLSPAACFPSTATTGATDESSYGDAGDSYSDDTSAAETQGGNRYRDAPYKRMVNPGERESVCTCVRCKSTAHFQPPPTTVQASVTDTPLRARRVHRWWSRCRSRSTAVT